MIDFNQIVRNILFEQEVTGSEQEQEKLYRDGLAAYIKKIFSDLKNIFLTQYGSANKFVEEPQIVPLVNNVTYGAGKTRSGGYDKDQIEQIFPLYDFVAYLYENYFKGKSTPENTDLDKAFGIFKTTLQKSSKIPLEFPAMSSWGKNVKEDYTQLSKQEIGKIKFESLNPEMSFWAAIKILLESYQKAKFTFTPNWMDKLQGVTSIQKIFSNPNIAREGKFVFNDDRLNILYDSLSKQTITNLAIAAYRLYEHQLRSNVTDEKEIETLKKDNVQFQRFMGTNAPGEKAGEVFWVNPKIKGAGDGSKIGESLSFNQTSKMLSKRLLKEMQSVGIPSTPAAQAEETPTAPISQFAGTKPGMFLYNIGNLKKPTQIPEVTAFIKALQDLANKLKSKSTPDILGTATALVQAASLGVKNMGT